MVFLKRKLNNSGCVARTGEIHGMKEHWLLLYIQNDGRAYSTVKGIHIAICYTFN